MEILLSVCIRTHNQERFIRETLDSVLCQKTNFPFEVIVSDDASSDGTRAILHEYANEYPEKVRLLLSETNLGGPKNLQRVIEESQAKYITCLDGDDYYTDEYKLQKQVYFLETNLEYAACFHNTWMVDAMGNKQGLFNKPNFHAVHDAREFIKERWFVPIHSAVLRREYVEFPEWYDMVMNDDYVVHLSVAKHGAYYYMSDVMVAYRRHEQNISHAYGDMILTNTQLFTILEHMKPLYPDEYAADFDARIAEYKAEIADLQLLQAQPWRKWLRRKTYTRAVRRALAKVIK